MYYLPAYVVVARWAAGQDVLVVDPVDGAGVSYLQAGGARVVVVQSDAALPVPDGSMDMVLCVEAYGSLGEGHRRELLEETRRVLKPSGMFVVWLEQEYGSVFGHALRAPVALDFWTMEAELSHRFSRVALLAQVPWQGFAMAPVPADDAAGAGEPSLVLDEGLLAEVPRASHYLAVASAGDLPPRVLEDCLLVPMVDLPPGPDPEQYQALEQQLAAAQRAADDIRGQLEEAQARLTETTHELELARDDLDVQAARAADAQTRVRELEAQLNHLRVLDGERQTTSATVESLRAELESAREALAGERNLHQATVVRLEQGQDRIRTLETDLSVLTKALDEHEHALTRANESSASRVAELQERTRRMEELQQRADALDAEREELARQLDVAVAEREGIRQLASRIEAELELTRKRISTQDEQLAAKIEQASRVTAEVDVLRKQVESQEAALEKTRSRADELTASAAQGIEQGRVLADVALDRDRLREELGKRSAEIRDLEQRLWAAREEVQRERLENVRNAAQLEALRERSERSLDNEKKQAEELERINGELRLVDLERSELRGLLRTRDEELERLQRDMENVASESQDLQALRDQLGERRRQIAELASELERARVRELDARGLVEQRERQLAEVGADLQRLREETEDKARSVAKLRGELDVKQVEVDQLAVQVGNLRLEVDQQRGRVAESERTIGGLQRRLEEGASEQQLLRNRLREREQHFEAAVTGRESSDVEMEKLRGELEEAARDNERLEEILRHQGGDTAGIGADVPSHWPADARLQVQQLRGQLAAQARRHTEQLARQRQIVDSERESTQGSRVVRELQIRAEEQEIMLVRLDEAEQRIWEMTDESDRNAARLAASLAELDKSRERLDSTLEELDVTRNLLHAAQTRALEQERLLGSERAKLARAGLESEPSRSGNKRDEASYAVDRLFAELNPKRVGTVMNLDTNRPVKGDESLVSKPPAVGLETSISAEPGATRERAGTGIPGKDLPKGDREAP